MECPHLTAPGVVTSGTGTATFVGLRANQGSPVCKVCQSSSAVWICVTCGQFNCGRYVKGHGVKHYEERKHPICMETKETSVYCYLCDDFIVNDTSDHRLSSLRTHLSKLDSYANPDSDDPESSNSGACVGDIDHAVMGASSTSSSAVPTPPSISEESSSRSSTSSSSSTTSGRRRRSEADRGLRPRGIGSKRSASSAGTGTADDRGGVENHRPLSAQVAVKKARVASSSPSTAAGVASAADVKKAKQQLKNIVGLRNLGNTCFMSAVLQSLSNIHEFCRVLKQLPSLESGSIVVTGALGVPPIKRETRNNGIPVVDGAIMTEELRKVLVALSQGEAKKAISPEALFHVIWKVVPRFRGYQQQDAHEFLRYMLDRLHTELLALLPDDLAFLQKNLSPYSRRISKGLTASSHSLVTSIFGGMLQSEVSCLVCKTSSKKHDPFLDLSIDIPNHFVQFRKGKEKEGEDSRPKCHLQDCLQKFTDVEELADSERFLCGRCNRKQPSTKKFWIRRLPNVLCLHIKRFRWSPYSRTKLDTHVAFPLDSLDMSHYLLSNLHETRCSNAGSCLYDLAAVIVHHGSGAGSGHYTAFGSKNSHWYHFNDSNVVSTDPETVAKSKAYILFYIQREFKLPTPS